MSARAENAAQSGGRKSLTPTAILHASSVSDAPGRNCIFVVGPYASRVNFYRQQNRALNLVWALSETPKFKNCRVAVIGAGLAGATAALGLSGIGCTVTLYEQNGALMSRQRGASHRMAHPTVNFWPDLLPLNPSTNFPFLNWLAAPASTIADDLKLEWERLRKTLRWAKDTTVLALTEVGERVQVVTNSPGHNRLYDCVILAAGFEDEETVSSVPTSRYWDGAQLAPPREGDSPVFVSGCGDGGLIEALRLSHDEFSGGRLIIQIAQCLQNGSIVRDVGERERTIRDQARSRGVPNGNDALAIEERADLYVNALDDLDDKIMGDLAASLILCKAPLVHLIGATAHPYLADAAPIHKLMVAHAIKHGRVKHLVNRLHLDGHLTLPLPQGLAFDPKRTIVRHGASRTKSGAPFRLDLLKAGEAETLRVRQGVQIDAFDEPIWEIGAFSNRLIRTGPQLKRFLEQHGQRAQRLGDLMPAISVDVSSPYTSFHYTVVGEPDDIQRQPPPSALFGVPLVKREPDIDSSDLGGDLT